MAIPKSTFTWPITGGLETIKSPLVVQPGSSLQLDDVIQTRLNEWRRRNGFTQSANDTSTSYAASPFVAPLGAQGVATHGSVAGPATYSSAFTSRWSALTGDKFASDITHSSIAPGTSGTLFGFASAGNIWMVADLRGVTVMDSATRTTAKATYANTPLRVRCAAISSTAMVTFSVSSAGSMDATVFGGQPGFTQYTGIKTGLHTTAPYIDAYWYGGSTITVVCRDASNQAVVMEFTPSTGVATTTATLGSVSRALCESCLSLLADPSASGVRFVCTSGNNTGNTTRVLRVDSAGAILTNNEVEAVLSTQITGVGGAAGADWSIVYKTAAGLLRNNAKVSGTVGTAATMRGGYTSTLSIDSMAWSESGTGYYQVVLGLHSTNTDDAQDSWVIVSIKTGFVFGAPPATFTRHSQVVPLQGAPALSATAALFQALRTGTRTFQFVLPVVVSYADDAGIIFRQYSLDVFTQTWMTQAEIATLNVGKPLQYKDTSYFPTNGLTFPDAGYMRMVGTAAPPIAPTLVQSGGGALTTAADYQYLIILESRDADGNEWRSPPSEPALITLTGGNTKVTVTIEFWNIEDVDRQWTVVLYRTDANGSTFRRIASGIVDFSVAIPYVDVLADTAIDDGAIAYTTGELATAITPRFNHLALFSDRLWGINADFRTELWPSRNLRPGRQPEFISEAVVDIDDGYGDLTGISNLDDKGVAFKKSAVYFIQGEGLSDGGAGSNYTYIQVANDAGAIPGSPIVTAGDMVYFVSERGIMTVNKQGVIDFVGAGVDQYLNQPEVQTPETVYDGCFVPAKNEVRFVTTNYVLVHNRIFNTWTRWTGLAGYKRCLVVNGVMWLFKGSDGTVWKEGTSAQTTDQGVAFTGVIRSPWMRPSFGPEGGGFKPTPAQNGIRVYRGRAIYTRTAGGSNATLIGKIYLNNDDTQVETFTSAAIAGSTLSGTGEMVPQNQKCTSFSIALILPSGDTTVRMEGFSAVCGPRSGSLALPAGNRWS